MKDCLLAVALVSVLASAASAVSISMVPDQASYLPGDTVTLDVVVDPTGGFAVSVFGRVEYDPAILVGGASSQNALTSFGGAGVWNLALSLPCGGGICIAFDQFPPAIVGVEADQGPGFVISTMTFTAGAVGSTNVVWTTGDAFAGGLDFFGLTNAPGTTVTVVPEPATAALLALGLALAANRVRTRA